MKKTKKITTRIFRFLQGRFMAGSALLMAIALMLIYATVNMRTVSISDGNQQQNLMSTSTDSGAILRVAGLELDNADIVTADWQFARAQINVDRAFTVVLSVDGVSRTVDMTKGTVADALQKADITLGQDDTLSLPPETVLTENTTVTVDRVTYREREEISEIPYGSNTVERTELPLGETQVVTSGVNGEKVTVYRDKLINGKVVESSVISTTVTEDPVDEIIAVGTYEAPAVPPAPPSESGSSGSTGGFTLDFEYTAVYHGSGTAYTTENDPDALTASGMKPQRGVVAVDPRIIPYGTRLYIAVEGFPDYGYCVAGDTGGFIYSGTNTIADLYFDTLDECIQFGRRNITVYVLA